MRLYGNQVGEPQTKSLDDGLFEIRAKGAEGIGRGIFCYMMGKRVYILHVFVKKSDKIPQKELDIARNRLKELKMPEVKFDDVFNEMMKNDEFRAEYEALMPEYELKSELIKARIKSGLTQSQLAERMGMKQSNLARLESASGEDGHETVQSS